MMMEKWYNSKRQDHANRRNAGEEISLENKLKQIGVQKRLCERNLDMEIKFMVEKQRRLGHRTFSLPDELDLVPAPATPLKKRILRAGKIDRVDLEVDLDQRSVQSDQPYVKRARINSETSEDFGRYNTMEVLVPEPTVMKTMTSEMNRNSARRNTNGITREVLSEYYAEELKNGKPRTNIQR
ncbi:hypothetical protein ACHWQZ_G003609 [Mnemiopsis leidyi]